MPNACSPTARCVSAAATQTPLAGFDENRYVPAGRFDQRPVASLTAELRTVRHATVSLLAGLPDEAWTRAGTASGYPVTVRGAGLDHRRP
jgi:hypothetical protein